MDMDEVKRATLPEPVRYWEPRRYLYNAVLAIVIVGWVVLTWPHFDVPLSSEAIPFLVFLFVMANVCYTAAYLIDIPLQRTALAASWRQWRCLLWLAGMLLAVLFLNYWIADEIYPYVP